jgi:biopolymer transport protein ExbB
LALLGPGLLAWAPAAAWEPTQGSSSSATPSGPNVSGNRSEGGLDDTGTQAASGTDAANGTSRLDAREPILTWAIRASGPIGLVIAIMSFYLIALVVWMALNYRRPAAIPGELVRDVQGLLDQAKYQEAYHRLLDDPSFLARVLAAGVRKLPVGLNQAQRAMEMANEDATMEMEHRTTYLATVGTLGPMIGLVGTVYGMILAFRVIAQEGSTPQAADLARGISTALFATLEGIALSIPAIYFYALFRNRIARLSLEVGMTAEPLLEQFAPGVRMASPSPGSSAGTGSTQRPSPPAHAHPLAVRATLAAAGGASAPRSALPPAETTTTAD